MRMELSNAEFVKLRRIERYMCLNIHQLNHVR
jgi:hypothetical protein